VVLARSGEASEVTFTASYDGATRFECVADGQKIRLEDLDDVTARPLRFAAIAALARRPLHPGTARAALDLARGLGHLAASEAREMGGDFTRMTLALLQSPIGGEAAWELAGELLERADLAEQAQLVEDLVWDHMAQLRESKRTLPRALKAIAERLRLASEADA
jgi:hypothetical protein